MASGLFDSYKQQLLDGTAPDLDTNTIKVQLINLGTDNVTAEATQLTTFDFRDDYTEYLSVTAATLAAKTVTDGVFDDTAVSTFTAVAIDGAKTVDALFIYQDVGTAATDKLIAFITGFTAVTPNGGDITITWNASGIFAI